MKGNGKYEENIGLNIFLYGIEILKKKSRMRRMADAEEILEKKVRLKRTQTDDIANHTHHSQWLSILHREKSNQQKNCIKKIFNLKEKECSRRK